MKRTISALLAVLLAVSGLSSCAEVLAEPASTGYDDYAEELTTDEFTMPDLENFTLPSFDTAKAAEETVTTAASDHESEVTTIMSEINAKLSEPTAETTTAEVNESPAAKNCLYVPYYSQEDYPTGCELVSTSMLLAYYGLDITAQQLIEQGYIKTAELTWDKNDKSLLHGGDPHKVFIGDPYDENGYGCYSGAIYLALERLFNDKNGLPRLIGENYFDAGLLNGLSLPDLCAEYIDFDTPVLVWASINMEPTFVKPENTWLIDGAGETFTWISGEHCLVLVGYDDNNYYFHDPLAGEAVQYERKLVEKRYEELGRQALTIRQW